MHIIIIIGKYLTKTYGQVSITTLLYHGSWYCILLIVIMAEDLNKNNSKCMLSLYHL